MSAPDQASIRNRLLSALSPASFAKLQPHLEAIDLPFRMSLIEPFQPTERVFFIESGLGSIIAIGSDEQEQIEVGHIGREGMAGLHLALGADRTSNRTFMQAAGAGLRLPAPIFAEILEADADLRALMLRYVHTYQIQLSQTALANGRYTMSQRLARWLLMYHDRLDGGDMPLTHEFLSLMLGVRRSGVTNEIHILEGMHVIKATRGNIRILDRPRLEQIAGGCYGVPEREYERLIGAPVSPRQRPPAQPAEGSPGLRIASE